MSAKTIIVVCLVALGLGPFRIAEGQQPKKIPRIGFVTFSQVSAGGSTSILESFRRGLRDLGYVEGQTIIIDRRDAEGRLDRIPALVQDIVNQKVDVIVAPNNVAIRAAKELTKTIPIVMVSSL